MGKSWGSTAARVGAYIDRLAGGGPDVVKHATIAKHINAMIEGAQFAGPPIGRWREGKHEVSPANLSAIARAYGRNPVEAFVIADFLDMEDAIGALGPESLDLLREFGFDVPKSGDSSINATA